MAGKNVVREDVVQVSFDIEDNPFGDLLEEVGSVKDFVEGMITGMTEEFDKIKKECTEAASGVSEITKECTEMKSAADRITGSIEQFDDGFGKVKEKAADFKKKLLEIANAGIDKIIHPIKTVKTALGSAVEAAGGFVTKLKDIGKQNPNSLISRLTQVKNALTQGKTGASSFVTALKNIGKVSVVGVVKGIGDIKTRAKEATDKIKQLAKEKLTSLKNNVEDIKKSFKDLSSEAQDSLKKIQGFSEKLLLGIGAGITAGVGASIKVGKEFQGSMSQVAATMGTTVGTEEYKILSDAAKEMGATTAFSAKEAAEALNYLALAGYDAKKAANALPTVLNLAGAGAMELATASDMVTDAMSALGIEATSDNLNNFADKLAKTAQKSNTSVQQLGEAILTVGGTAKNMAGGTTELNAALGTLANVGLKGSEGGTHLRNMLLSLQTPTDDAVGLMNDLGVSVYDAQGQMRSINDIFKDLKRGMSGMKNSEVDSVISTIFNRTDLAAAQGLLAGCGDAFDELVGEIENSKDACSDMYKTMLDNLDGDIAIFQSSLSALGTAIFESADSPLRSIVQIASEFITKLKEGFESGGLRGMIQSLGPGVIAIASALGAVITAVAGITAAWKIYKTAQAAATVVQWAMNTALFSCPIFWIVAAIAALIAIIVVCIVYWDKIKSAALICWEKIKEAWGAAVDFFKGIWEGVKGTFGKVKDWFSEKFSGAFDAAKEVVFEKLGAIKTAYEEHGGGIQGVIFGSIEAVKGYYTAGYDFVNKLTGGKLGEIVKIGKDKLEQFARNVYEKFEGIKTKVSTVFENVKTIINNAIEKIKGFFKFNWELPKLKVPKFNITPEGWKVGDLLKGSIPKLDVVWNAKGGIMEKPTIFGMSGNSFMAGGEAGAEAILPLKDFWRNLKDFTAKSQEPLTEKYIPEHDAAVYHNSSSRTINNYSNFNLTISGSEDDRKMARKIKKWVKEAIREEDESIERRNFNFQTI